MKTLSGDIERDRIYMTSVLKALALYNNEAEDADELSFKINDLLIVLQEDWQDGWHLCQVFLPP
jgi:hypothetical protein